MTPNTDEMSRSFKAVLWVLSTITRRVQRWKIKRALKRGWVLRRLRCHLGLHNPPGNAAFEEWGCVVIGGACTDCDDDTWHVVAYIGDAWDFPGATTSETSSNGTTTVTISNSKLLDGVNAYVAELMN